MIIICIILICVFIGIFMMAYDGCKRSNPLNVDGYTGKIVEILAGNTCKVCISTIEGVVTVIAMNDIHAIEGDYVKIKISKNNDYFYISERLPKEKNREYQEMA